MGGITMEKIARDAGFFPPPKFIERALKETDTKHVWRDVNTGKFHYSDEAEQIVPTPYDTEVDANTALSHYVEHVLGK
jgi:hypothetical protein